VAVPLGRTSDGVALSSGPSFGRPGVGHVGLNMGTSRRILTEAVDRMATSVWGYPR